MGKLTCGLVYQTHLPISHVQDWLDDNCKHDWDLALADLAVGDSSDGKKKIEIYFESPDDRDRFKTLFKAFEKGV